MSIQTAFDFDAPVVTPSRLISMVAAYRKRKDEKILEWWARAQIEQHHIVKAFLEMGGVIWCERGEVRCELNGFVAREPNRAPDDHHNFLPVLRWVERIS